MNLSQSAAQAGLDAIKALYNGGSLRFYGSQALPATPETALSGAVNLVSFTFSATAFGSDTFASGYQTAPGSFVASSIAPVANGTAIFARAVRADGTTVISDHIVAAAWQASSAVLINQYATNGGNLYQVITGGTTASSGGPTGTSSSITDNTAGWKYVGPASQADLILGSTTISLGVNVSITSFSLGVPGV
jgi:hypothetical protein